MRCAISITSLLLLLLAAGCVDRATGSRPAFSGEPMSNPDLQMRAERLLLQAAQGDIDVVRCNAIEALTQVAPEAGRQAFVESLRNESPMVRYAGCVALGEQRSKDARTELLRLLNDESPRVRLGAAFALARAGEKNAAAYLVGGLNSHDENLRCDAAYLVGRLGDPAAVKRLKYVESGEKSGKVLVHIHGALAMLGQPQSVERLISYTAGDAVSRIVALQTLVELRNDRAVDAFKLIYSGQKNYLQLRLLAARGLGRLGYDTGYKLALQSLNYSAKEAEPEEVLSVRTLAALTLGSIGKSDALPDLRRVAEAEPDERIQVAAACAICQIVTGKR